MTVTVAEQVSPGLNPWARDFVAGNCQIIEVRGESQKIIRVAYEFEPMRYVHIGGGEIYLLRGFVLSNGQKVYEVVQDNLPTPLPYMITLALVRDFSEVIHESLWTPTMIEEERFFALA